MGDLLKKFWERAVSEGGVIQNAPFTFGIGVLILTAAVTLIAWQALDWKYSSIIGNRDASIAARDAQIGLMATQIKDLTDKIEDLKPKMPPTNDIVDPDSILQNGKVVGRALGAIPDKGNGKMYFRILYTIGDFNQSSTFQYRDLKMKIDKTSGDSYASLGGEERRQFFDVSCIIISN